MGPSASRRKALLRQYKQEQKTLARERMCLKKSELLALLAWLDVRLGDTPCDHSFAHTYKWAEKSGIDRNILTASLGEFGAFCDCEVVMNIEPENLFD